MKRISILLITAMLTISASAYDFMVNGLYYSKNNDGISVTITYGEYRHYSESLIIPSSVSYNGTTYSVTSIGPNAFQHSNELTLVSIPNSVLYINSSAFRGCDALPTVSIPNSVILIGDEAFKDCKGLTSVTIGNSVKIIEMNAFYGCSGLTSVTIGNSVNTIGYCAFLGCSGLTSVTIPNSVTSIGQSAFSRCRGLTSVTIPNSVTSIGQYAFSDCIALKSVTIPNSLTSIEASTFLNCYGLESVTIPKSITKIGNNAFYSCIGLTRIDAYPDPTKVIMGKDVFYSVPRSCTLHVLPKYLTLYQTTSLWNIFNNIVPDLSESNGIEEVLIDELDDTQSLDVYNLNGVKVAQSLDELPAGIYIVRQGNKSVKVVR